MNESTPNRSADPFAPEAILEGLEGTSSEDVYIIVVCASAPILTAVKALSGFHRCKLDQVSHVENGRRYYRLRMGFFVTLAQAEAALAKIRKHYQASFIERVSAAGARDRDEATAFAIQLASSKQPIDLAGVPRLEVFIAYRLYSILPLHGAQHVLRLGFFDNEASAHIIARYLENFFESPSVVRVSAAERADYDTDAQT